MQNGAEDGKSLEMKAKPFIEQFTKEVEGERVLSAIGKRSRQNRSTIIPQYISLLYINIPRYVSKVVGDKVVSTIELRGRQNPLHLLLNEEADRTLYIYY